MLSYTNVKFNSDCALAYVCVNKDFNVLKKTLSYHYWMSPW